MGENDIGNLTYTDMKGGVSEYSVDAKTPDSETGNGMVVWDHNKSSEYLGYYKSVPELKKAIDALATWTTGKGYEINKANVRLRVDLDNMHGWGEDSFTSICWNLVVQKKVFGDAFAEIIRDENDRGRLLNIKPLYPGSIRTVVNEQGIIDHYEQLSRVKGGKRKVLRPNQILHLVNDRVANEIHGTSVIEACKWVIDARNEAMEDLRKGIHRSSLRVIYVDVDNVTKLATIKSQWASAVNAKEAILLPGRKGTDFEVVDYTFPDVGSYIQWIQYLENFFYQAVGVPRVIATSENFTEAASKVGYLTFEPIYTREQTELENDLRAQVGIDVKFNRPPSLSGMLQDSEEKNTGQTGFQPNEVKPSVTRNE